MRAFGIALVAFASFTTSVLAQKPAGLQPVAPTKRAPDDKDKKDKKDKGDKGDKKNDAKAAPTRRPMPAFVTYGQDAWAGPEANPTAAKILAQHFDEAFPEGILVGVEGKDSKSYTLKTLKAVRRFLPNGGKSDIMKDSNFESLEDCGALAGQLVAAKINVRLTSKGFLGESQQDAKNPLLLRELKYQRGVDGNIQKMSVERVIKLADRALAGEFGKPDNSKTAFIDTNNDDKKDVSLDDLRKALLVFNANFEDGENDGRFVAKGYTNEVPADEKAAATAAGGAAVGGAAAGAANADADEDAGDAKLDAERKELEEANAARDRDLDALEKAHDDAITQARQDARRAGGDAAAYEAKKAEIDTDYQRKRAQILAKHQQQLEAFRAKHGRAHPGKGKGLERAGGDDRRDDGKRDKDGKDKRDGG